jgi:hypothetical protein
VTFGSWRKSSYSGGAETQCVEVALGEVVGVRDSKTPGHFTVPRTAWVAVAHAAASGELTGTR